MGSRQKRVMDKVEVESEDMLLSWRVMGKVEVESEDMLLSCPLLKATVLFTL